MNEERCATCGGTGVVEFIENGAPHGCGFWAMPVQEGCEDCVGHGKCPICGADLAGAAACDPPWICLRGHASDDDGRFGPEDATR